jgi:uncharacterized membrane protein
MERVLMNRFRQAAGVEPLDLRCGPGSNGLEAGSCRAFGERSRQMSTLVAVVFDDEHTAFQMRAELARMQKEYLVELEDAVVVTRDLSGRTKLDQAVNLTSAGAWGGGFWGLLIGMIFLNPLLGAAIGAGAGALSGKFTDIGLDDRMMKDVARSFKPGTSGLFVIIRKATTDKVLSGLKQFAGKGKVFQTSLNKDDEAALRAALEKPDKVTA